MFVTLKRIFKSGWLMIKRNGGLSLATIFIMVLTIGLITSFFLLQGMSESLISTLKEKVDISVYFKKDIPEEEITRIKDDISRIPEVKNIEYVSRQEALDTFIEKHKDDYRIMESLKEIGDNPFLASLNIKAWESFQYEKVSEFLNGASYKEMIEKVDYYQRKSIIERIFSISSIVTKVGIGVGITLGILAALITFNTIKLAIFNFKEEISIMRLVGASNWFIRWPFIIQAMISSLSAVLITLLIFFPLCYFSSPKLEFFIPGFNLYNFLITNFWTLLLIQVVIGIGIGALSSVIAIRRYLRV